jgi:hypothetical protein
MTDQRIDRDEDGASAADVEDARDGSESAAADTARADSPAEEAPPAIAGEPAEMQQPTAAWNAADWEGKMLIDRDGEKIGKLREVYVDVETDHPQFATVKEGLIGRHLTFVPLDGINVGPDRLQVAVTRARVQDAPNIDLHGDELSQADESRLYHHYELNYTPPDTDSGRRLARR